MEDKKLLERTYNVPLRKEFMKVPKYKRARKAVIAVKEFVSKHMKANDVKLGKFLNEKIWERGIKRPPHHVEINVKPNKDGILIAELVGAPVVEEVVEENKKSKVSKKSTSGDDSKVNSGVSKKSDDKKDFEIKEVPKEDVSKTEEKKELKESEKPSTKEETKKDIKK